jgi:hypothetical protein
VTVFTQVPLPFKDAISVKKRKREMTETPQWNTTLTWACESDGVQKLVEVARKADKIIETKEQLCEVLDLNKSRTGKVGYPDLLISLGPSPGMPLAGVPPILMANADVIYSRTSPTVLEFYRLLETFSSIEQRYGK